MVSIWKIYFKMQDDAYNCFIAKKKQRIEAQKLTNLSSQHFELVEKIDEQMGSLKMQLKIYETLKTHQQHPQYQHSNIEPQLQAIKKKRQEFEHKLSKKLINIQINIDEQRENSCHLQNYEQRVTEMFMSLHYKQRVITVDHIGKLQNEKPQYKNIREFNINDQQSQKIMLILKAIGELKVSMPEEVLGKPESVLSESTKDETKDEKKLEGYRDLEDYPRKNVELEAEKENISYRRVDPSIIKMMQMIKRQDYVLRSLSSQYEKLCKYHTDLQDQHNRLVQMYYNMK